MSNTANPTIHQVFVNDFFEPARKSSDKHHVTNYAAYLIAQDQFSKTHGFDYPYGFRTVEKYKNADGRETVNPDKSFR